MTIAPISAPDVRLHLRPAAGPGWEGTASELAQEGPELAGEVTLLTPSEQLGDLWPIFRSIAAVLAPGALLTVQCGRPAAAGYRLRSRDVATILRLSGFTPLRIARSDGGYVVTGRRELREPSPLSCTIVVPCRNELENVGPLVGRVPALGVHTELLFVDGGSTDGTPQRIEELIRQHPDRDIKLLQQTQGPGKAGAVFEGFDAAAGDILMILDADMTVAPEDLPRFFLALAEGIARLANGTRLVYPMETGAMPLLNTAGNHAFGLFLSWLLRTQITDSLCGTKALFKRDWPAISDARRRLGGHDPWGDFDLLLGARLAGLDIVEVAVPYGARVAGESKMHPFQHGTALARTCIAGTRHLRLDRSGSRAGSR